MNYNDLTQEEKQICHAKIVELLDPIAEKGIIKKGPLHNGRPSYRCFVDPMKLMEVINLSQKAKGEPNDLIINGKKVFLSLLPFLLMLNSIDDEAEEKLDKYLLELRAQQKK